MKFPDVLELLSAEELRNRYGVRFHHFHNNAGRLVATLVSAPENTGQGTVLVAVAFVSKSEKRVTRSRGRALAFDYLLSGKRMVFDQHVLRREITERTILTYWPGSGGRLGPSKLRPPKPFLPKARTPDDLGFYDDDLPF